MIGTNLKMLSFHSPLNARRQVPCSRYSTSILKAGYTLDSLLFRYSGVDWRNTKNWNCNNCRFPSRSGTNDGISMHPFETIFHKRFWSSEPKMVMNSVCQKYMQWFRESQYTKQLQGGSKTAKLDKSTGSWRNDTTIVLILCLLSLYFIVSAPVVLFWSLYPMGVGETRTGSKIKT